jgi:hypothetical protein
MLEKIPVPYSAEAADMAKRLAQECDETALLCERLIKALRMLGPAKHPVEGIDHLS